MTSHLTAVGLNIVHARAEFGATVALDHSISRPATAGDDHVYGLFGDYAQRQFLYELANRDARVGRPSYEYTKLMVSVPHDQTIVFDAGVGLSGLTFLGKNARAGFRKAFHALFCDVIQQIYGDSPTLTALRNKDTSAGFQKAMLAFPECITTAMGLTDIIVAVVPMRVQFGLDLWVSIVAKKALSSLLRSIETGGGDERRCCITHADGRREMLVPPIAERQLITIDSRPGAVWRRGKHHPGNLGAAAS